MRYLLLGLATVLAAYGQGTWTQIMNSGGTTSESSTQFIIFNSSTTPDPVVTSSTTTSYHEPVTLSKDSSGNIWETGTSGSTCQTTGVAGQLYRSYLGPWNWPTGQYKGLAVLATLGYNSSDVTGYSGSPDLEQTAFFHEQQCYNGGREYGFVLNGLTGYLEFYTLTNANLGGGYVAHDVVGTGYAEANITLKSGPLPTHLTSAILRR